MAKGRKRRNVPPHGNEPRFRMPPPGGPPPSVACWGRPPHPGEFGGPPVHPMGPHGPRMPGERFAMGPRDFGPSCAPGIEEDFMMSRQFVRKDFPPPEFGGTPGFHQFECAPRFPCSDFGDGPRGFRPPELEGAPPFPPPDFEGRPPDHPPLEFDGRPGPGFCPPPYEAGRVFHSAELDGRRPSFVPPDFRGGGPPGLRPPEFEGRPGPGPLGGYSAVDPNYMPPLGAHDTALPSVPCPPSSIPNKTDQQPSNQTKNENKTMASKTVISTVKNASRYVKPPPGRSMGVISFIGSNYGFIEREDLKKFSFLFEAYFGNRGLLVPGVKVHFTAVKELGKECATDVKVAPGGTEEIEETVYEGVVITVLPDTYVSEPHPGRIRTILSTDPIKLCFGKADTKATLLMYDRVKFQLLTDILTKDKRATNITPHIPETFQLTKETREKGVIMNINENIYTVLSKEHKNLTASVDENLSEDKLNVMDEVEFTTITVKDTVKAIRLKKLPEGSVVFDSEAKNKIAEVKVKICDPSSGKDKWKPVTSEIVNEDAGVSEEVSSEKYEGTIFQAVPKHSMKEGKEVEEQEPSQGFLESTVAGTQKRLPFKSGDVISQATMMVGDKVLFNICINKETKKERAVSIEIQPESFQTDSAEQRKIGVVVQLDENSGFIKTPQDLQLYFELSEVVDATQLALSEKVEFTLATNEDAEEGKRAIRIRRLTESIFTSVPKLEALGEKEKKKMTIKLLREPNKQIKTEVKTGDLGDAKKPEKGKNEASKGVKPAKEQKQEFKVKQEKDKVDREQSRSRENSQRRNNRSRSHSRDRSGSYYRRHRSSSCEKSYSRYTQSRSHSRDGTHRYRRSRSRSKSRERNNRSAKKRSHSPEYRHDHHKRPSNSKEQQSSKRRSRSPDKKSEGIKTSKLAASSSDCTDPSSGNVVEDELEQKRKELLELNELIARKRAIIAMEQNAKSFKGVLEMDRKHGFATFDYQHKTCLESTWIPDMKPAKSILKKHSDPLPDPQLQASKRNPEEPTGHPTSNTTNPYACSAPAWVDQSSLHKIEDLELARKKRQIEELSESIARQRAIVAMEQKTKASFDEPEIKKEYEFASCSDDLAISAPNKELWRLDRKPELQPKKSILKKRSDPLTEHQQRDKITTEQHHYDHALFPICKPPQDDFAKPPASSHATVQKSTVSPSTVNIFKKLIKDVSSTSRLSESAPFNDQPGQRSFPQESNSGPFYGQKSTEEAKASYSYEDTSSISHRQNRQTSLQAYDQSSVSDCPATQPSTSEQKSNVATQMQRFLSALNKADSSLLSSLLQEARKDSVSLGSQKSAQVPPSRKMLHKDELYDPFSETEDNEENSFLMERKPRTNVDLGQVEKYLEDHGGEDDLLPHERAVQDGSGFSKIVGMKYGTESTAEKQFLYEDKMSNSQNKISEQQKWFSQQNQYELHQNHYSGYQNPYSHLQEPSAKNREQYESQKESKNYKVGASLSSVHQTSEVMGSEDGVKRSEHFEKIQNLLQTIGLKLNTSEVSKLTDRTRERLYGKKVKPQSSSSHSVDQKEEQSTSRYDRKGSRTDSTDSEGVSSVSPARSSNREVYMSYLDTIKYQDHHDEAPFMKERVLVNVKRTIKNSPEARKVTDASELKPSTKVTHDSYKSTTELPSTSAQSINFLYTPRATESLSATPYLKSQQGSWESSYPLKGNSQAPVSTYSSVPPSLLHYPPAIPVPPPHIPPVYGSYRTPLLPTPPPFPTPAPFLPSPTTMYPCPPGQFNMSMLPGSSGYAISQAKIKPAAPTRCLKTIETVKTEELVSAKPALSNVQPALISIQPVEEAQPKDTQVEDESKQVAPIMEDDIKAKQKKRLEQFNQRMRLKKEQQMEAQRTRGQSQKSTPGKVTRNEVKNAWICGHSLVFWAEKRATSPEIGMQLGMDPNSVRIWWKGVQGMTWQQLLPQLLQLKDNWPKPDLILIHLGGNDIGKTTTEAFLAAVKKDLISMKSIFPECLLVWSDILPRRSWRHSADSVAVDNMRKAINKSINSILTELGGSSLTHENIKPGLDTGLYRPDGVHLSGKGIDTFNLNMQDFLEKWEGEINEAEPSDI